MNHNEVFNLKSYLKIILISSQYELGSSNIILEFYDKKIGILCKSSNFKYRYPKDFDLNALVGSDLLISMPDLINYKNDYESQLNIMTSEIYKIVSKQDINSIHYPTLFIPTEWSFLLDYVDLLKYKVPQEVKNIYISNSIKAILEYSNISHSFINPQIHSKIFDFKLPFQFDELMKNERLFYFEDFEDFLKNFIQNKSSNNSPIIFMVSKFSFAFGMAQTIFDNFVNNSTPSDALIYLNLKLKNIHEQFNTFDKNSDFKFKTLNFNLDHRLTFEQFRQILLDVLKPQKFYYFDREGKNLDFVKFIINSSNNQSEKISYSSDKEIEINFDKDDIKYEKLFFLGKDPKEYENFIDKNLNTHDDKSFNIKVEKENDNLFIKLSPDVNLFKSNKTPLENFEEDLNILLKLNNMSVIELLSKENSIRISILKKNQEEEIESYSDVILNLGDDSEINIQTENYEDSQFLNKIFQLQFS